MEGRCDEAADPRLDVVADTAPPGENALNDGTRRGEGYTYPRSAFRAVEPSGRTASHKREDLHGAVSRGLAPPASPRLARVE